LKEFWLNLLDPLLPDVFPVLFYDLFCVVQGFNYASKALVIYVKKPDHYAFDDTEASSAFDFIEGVIVKKI
jgi:hypothetical protein